MLHRHAPPSPRWRATHMQTSAKMSEVRAACSHQRECARSVSEPPRALDPALSTLTDAHGWVGRHIRRRRAVIGHTCRMAWAKAARRLLTACGIVTSEAAAPTRPRRSSAPRPLRSPTSVAISSTRPDAVTPTYGHGLTAWPAICTVSMSAPSACARYPQLSQASSDPLASPASRGRIRPGRTQRGDFAAQVGMVKPWRAADGADGKRGRRACKSPNLQVL